MTSKRLLQIFVLFALLFSPMGNVQNAQASANSALQVEPMVINRDMDFWDATYVGFVSSSVYEKWRFEFTAAHQFVVTASPITGGLVPLLILLDANDNELARGTGTLTSTQPAGTYYILVQPESGSGFYFLTIREIVNLQPSVSTSVNPTSVNMGESAVVTVSLNNVPAEGYTSAEFTCSYNDLLVAPGNIEIGSLFGADAAAAFNGPNNGSFIVAIAGSNGNKATTSGPVFTFAVTGLQGGQTPIECTARVSKGDNLLASLPSTGTGLTILSVPITATFTPTPVGSPTATSTPDGSATPVPSQTSTPDGSPTSTPDGSATPTASQTSTPDGSATATQTFTSTPVESPTPTLTSTPIESPTPTFTSTPLPTNTPTITATPLPAGSLTGQVIAGKPVTVSLYDAGNNLVASVPANPDGTFNLTAPAGTYTVKATASGFLSASGSATITSGGSTSMPNVTLLAGDIDSNNVIDQFDALTIGMNYNASIPAAADLNNDGTINVLDLELLAANYRETGPIVWQ